MPLRPQASDGRRPNQGALVVLLSAMAMVNAAVLLLVFAGDRLWGGGEVQSHQTEVAQAQVEPIEERPGAGVLPDEPTSAARQGSAIDSAPLSTDSPVERLSIEPSADVPLQPVEPAPVVAVAEDEPAIPTTVDLPPLEFFGIPVLD